MDCSWYLRAVILNVFHFEEPKAYTKILSRVPHLARFLLLGVITKQKKFIYSMFSSKAIKSVT